MNDSADELTVIDGIAALQAAVGLRAVTRWHPVEQSTVDAFAAASGDRNPLHVDPAAARASPFRTTIAHGAWLLSAVPPWYAELVAFEGFRYGVLYGYGRVRFPAPLPVGSRVRMHVHLATVEPVADGARVTSELSFECDGAERPACVAEHIVALGT